MIYDVVIIGLGPAGSTLARFLPKEFKVIALDKKSDNQDNVSFRKPCGGLLAPDAQKALSRFGLTLPKSILVNPQIFSVRTIDVKSGLLRHYQRFYMNMDRHKFDLWLKSLIPENVEIAAPCIVKRVEKTKSGWNVSYSQNGENKMVSARFIIGADGANSIVRKSIFSNKKTRAYLSIQQWYKNKNPAPFYASIFDPCTTDCYAWGLSKNEHFIFGGAFEPKDARKSFEKLKQRLAPFGFDFSNPIKTEACLVLRAASPFQFCMARDNAFLIGEAAGLISPSSLEGISYAIESGYILGKIFGKALGNAKAYQKAYKKETAGLRFKLTLKLLKCPLMYNRFLRKIVMKSGVGAIDIVGGTEKDFGEI
ncbi:MAG: FAD-binding protein [Oscillospiraceae bacterium]|nr:FAD-binding protein [Oscillospiraceae bacterium]